MSPPPAGPQASGYLRLRQVCLAVPSLAPAERAFCAIFGTQVCFRDLNVGKYGLENAIVRIGSSFIEFVAPLRAGTAVERFMARTGGRGGYMLIFDCDNPGQRQAHAQSMGVRTANLIDVPGYLGVQLDPRDTGATMIEFNHTPGGADLDGPYHPAGPDWRQSPPSRLALGLGTVSVSVPEPEAFAQRWAALMQRPLQADAGHEPVLSLDAGRMRFVASPPAERAAFSAFDIVVSDPAAVRASAQPLGLLDETGAVRLGGVQIRPVATA